MSVQVCGCVCANVWVSVQVCGVSIYAGVCVCVYISRCGWVCLCRCVGVSLQGCVCLCRCKCGCLCRCGCVCIMYYVQCVGV